MPKQTQPKYPIDLAKTPKDLDMPTVAGEDSKPIYPTLFLSWDKPYGFPDEGTMTVRFRKSSETNKKKGDKTVQNVDLDIMEILDTKGTDKPEAKEEDPGDVLDKELKTVTVKKSKKVVDSENETGTY